MVDRRCSPPQARASERTVWSRCFMYCASASGLISLTTNFASITIMLRQPFPTVDVRRALRKTLETLDGTVYMPSSRSRLVSGVTPVEFVDGVSTAVIAEASRSAGEFVDVSRDVPPPWADAMIRARLVDPRNGRPSMSRLAEAAQTHASTISAMMYGTRQTSPEVVERVVDALFAHEADSHRRRREVNGWIGRALSEDAAPFVPHPDAALLSPVEQKAVNEMIRLLAASKKQQAPADETSGVSDLKTRRAVPKSANAGPVAADDQDVDLDEEARQQAEST